MWSLSANSGGPPFTPTLLQSRPRTARTRDSGPSRPRRALRPPSPKNLGAMSAVVEGTPVVRGQPLARGQMISL